MELNKVNGELTGLFKSLSSIPDQIKSTDVELSNESVSTKF